MTRYTVEIEKTMLLYFSQLNEKNKYHYVALSAIKLGYGGKYISELFNISTYQIRSEIKELNTPELLDEIPLGKQRRKGGGRKKEISNPKIVEALCAFINRHKAGSPTNANVFVII